MFKNPFSSRLLLMIAALTTPSAFAAKEFPSPPVSYVYDEAGVIGPETPVLSRMLGEEDRNSGNQILVAVFKSLDGEDHVDYMNRLFKFWHPGEKGKNNGVLIAAYLAEKKIRIEVGYGLEPDLTDAKSKRILIDILGPAFREKKYGQGLIQAVTRIQRIIHHEANAQTETVGERTESKRNQNWFLNLLIFIVIAILLNYLDRRKSNTIGSTGIRRHYRDGGLFGGGSGGGMFGGGGGGGFSGGGGSSGGGGASGDW